VAGEADGEQQRQGGGGSSSDEEDGKVEQADLD
jgi:hypothetical protein